MAFYNPLLTKDQQSLSGLQAPTLGEPSIPMGYNPNIESQQQDPDIVPFIVRREELMGGMDQNLEQDDDLVPINIRRQQLIGQSPQEMWGEFNRPEDVVPLSSRQGTISGVADKLKETPLMQGQAGINSLKFGYGLLENAVSTLAGIPIDVAAGLSGLVHATGVALSNLGREDDKDAMAEAAKTVEGIRDYLNFYVSPETEQGKQIRQKFAEGIQSTVGALANYGKEKIVEPVAETFGDVFGPTAAGMAGAALTMAPEVAEFMITRGASGGTLRQNIKAVKRSIGEAVDSGVIKPTRSIAKAIGASDEWMTKYTPTLTRDSAVRKAREVLKSGMGEGVTAAKEAKWLEDEIIGLEWPSVSSFDDPGTMRMFMDLAKKDKEIGLSVLRKQQQNAEATRRYLQTIKTPSGDPAAVRLQLERERAKRLYELSKQQERFEGIKRTFEDRVDIPRTGTQIREELFGTSGEASKARDRATAILDELGDLNDDVITTRGLIKDIKNEATPESIAEVMSKGVPEEVRKFFDELNKRPPLLSIRELYKVRKTLRKARDDMDTSVDRNRFAQARMDRIIDVLDNHMKKTLMEPGKAADIIQRFRRAYYEDYIAKYETADMSAISRMNVKHNDYITNSMVAGKFIKKGDAGIDSGREFMTAANGNPGAIDALKTYVANDMVRAATDPVTGEFSKSGFRKWLFEHRPFLKEVGMEDGFRTMRDIEKQIDDANMFIQEFEKQYVSKIIDADIDGEIASILKLGSPIESMSELISYISDKPTAIKGLQNGLIDALDDLAADSVTDVKGLVKFYKKHENLYKKAFGETDIDKKRLKDLNRYVEAMDRNFRKGDLPDNFSDLEPVFREFYGSKQKSRLILPLILRNTIGLSRYIGRGEVKEIIRQMALDPKAAATLVRMGKYVEKGQPQKAGKTWKRYLIQIGVPAMTASAFRTGEGIPKIQTEKQPKEDMIRTLIDSLQRPRTTYE